jgi:exopolysaccharide biosynthesis polyprenyl glycosylphosphotransferase
MTAAHASQGLFSAGTQDPAFATRRSKTSARATKAAADALLLGSVDFLLVWLSAAVALCFRVDSGAISYGTSLVKNAGFLMSLSVLVVLFCQTQKLYEFHPRTRLGEAFAVFRAVGLATIVLSASIYLSGQKVVSRLALGITVLMSAALLISWRFLWHRMAKRAAEGAERRNVLVFGWSHSAQMLDQYAEHWLPGYVVKGFLDRRRTYRSPQDIAVENRRSVQRAAIGHVDDLERIVRAHFIDEIIVFLPEDRELVKDLIVRAREAEISLQVVPDSYDGSGFDAPVEYLGPFPAIQIHEKPMPMVGLITKRCVDFVCALLALIVCLPAGLLIAIAIRFDSPGAIFYCSPRIGRKGLTFTCWKFRTMVQNADDLLEKLQHRNERKGLLFKISDDPRITRVGRFLRKYSLDELPQFWNVLCGDMSLVGPRPPVPGEYRKYELDHLKRLHVTPGITGLWQVEARKDPSFENYINLDAQYVDNWSMWLDLKILLKTVAVVFAGTGQ